MEKLYTSNEMETVTKKLAEELEKYYRVGCDDASSIINAQEKANEKYFDIVDSFQSIIAPKYIHKLELDEYIDSDDVPTFDVESAISYVNCLSLGEFFNLLDEIDKNYLIASIVDAYEQIDDETT